MAGNLILTVKNGSIVIPQEMKNDPNFRDGAELELVSSEGSVVLHRQASVEIEPVGDWRRLEGLFAGSTINLNDELEKDRLRELKLDERMIRETSR